VNTPGTILPDWLKRSTENHTKHPALEWQDGQWSFGELDQQADQLARRLAALNVCAGERVALLAANSPAYVAFVHALTRLGAVLVPLNIRLSEKELSWQLSDVRATLLVSDHKHTALAEEIAQGLPEVAHAAISIQPASPQSSITHSVVLHSGDALVEATSDALLRTLIDLNDTQAIIYTSGTTGHPKGVLITYGMQWWNAIGSALNLGHDPADRWLACLPLFHVGGLSILMRSIINGISVVLHEKFDAIAINRALCEERVTIISVVAVMLQRMLAALETEQEDHGYPSTLRCVLLGGGPAPRPLLEDCARRGIPVSQSYGLTESCSQAVTLVPTDALRKLGSAGRPLLPVQLKIVQDDRTAHAGEAGIIHLKGPTITPGYADRPQETAQTIQDGWLSTGDMGYLDEEGYLYVLDRRNDLIISGGENVYPAEIEAVLLSHPDVEEAGVCGQPDEQWGQVPIAFVRPLPHSTIDIAALQAYAAERLARYKQPHTIHPVDQLPRNASGKLVRRKLPELLQDN
jgi:o-succinylbenzoate---CoA ligase